MDFTGRVFGFTLLTQPRHPNIPPRGEDIILSHVFHFGDCWYSNSNSLGNCSNSDRKAPHYLHYSNSCWSCL